MICSPPKPQEAKEYLQRAQSIFEQRGLQKLLKEVKEKIKLINWQMKQGGPFVAAGEADNIIEESAYDSNNEGPMNPQLQMQQPVGVRPHLQHQISAAGKKKKGVTKGLKKKREIGAVKTNNFMVGNDL